ncbi:hypothetical protein [Moorena producens]|uniref:hypothetical protein n=1 Tax=Moorena producens TaxID=1155739 RepID=UPI001E2FB05C|nr:hypothetical protein [Moorena producens]
MLPFRPITYYRLDAVAHGGNPQDRANHAITHYLLPITYYPLPITHYLLPS